MEMMENEQVVPEGAETVLPENGQDIVDAEQENLEVPEGQTQPDEWNPNEFALNFKGQTVLPKDKQHLLDLAQQGHGYSQKMEALKARQTEIDTLGQTYSKYQELDTVFKENPALQQEINKVVQQYQQGLISPEGEEIDPNVAQVQKELEDLKSFKTEFQQKEADRQLRTELDDLKAANPDYPWDVDDGNGTLEMKLLKHAHDTAAPNFKMAFRDYMWDNNTVSQRAAGAKQVQKSQQQQRAAGVVQRTGSPAPAPQASYNPNDSYSDLASKAIKELGH